MSTLENCQGYERQGKAEERSQIREEKWQLSAMWGHPEIEKKTSEI